MMLSTSARNIAISAPPTAEACRNPRKRTRDRSGENPDDVPRALWRLMAIAEMARLIGPLDQNRLVATLSDEFRAEALIGLVLNRFRCSRAELYILVTLFSAMPRYVSTDVLVRETLADEVTLRYGLTHLRELGMIAERTAADAKTEARLTDAGVRFAVSLMYRVVNAAL